MVISKLKGLPGQLEQAINPVVERLRHIGAQLDAASAMGDTIIARATERANVIDAKMNALNDVLKASASKV